MSIKYDIKIIQGKMYSNDEILIIYPENTRGQSGNPVLRTIQLCKSSNSTSHQPYYYSIGSVECGSTLKQNFGVQVLE